MYNPSEDIAGAIMPEDEWALYNPEPVDASPDRYLNGLTRVDFTVDNHGSICILIPENASARAWLDANLYDGDDGPQWFGSGVAVEPRYLNPILDGIEADGLTVDA